MEKKVNAPRAFRDINFHTHKLELHNLHQRGLGAASEFLFYSILFATTRKLPVQFSFKCSFCLNNFPLMIEALYFRSTWLNLGAREGQKVERSRQSLSLSRSLFAAFSLEASSDDVKLAFKWQIFWHFCRPGINYIQSQSAALGPADTFDLIKLLLLLL